MIEGEPKNSANSSNDQAWKNIGDNEKLSDIIEIINNKELTEHEKRIILTNRLKELREEQRALEADAARSKEEGQARSKEEEEARAREAAEARARKKDERRVIIKELNNMENGSAVREKERQEASNSTAPEGSEPTPAEPEPEPAPTPAEPEPEPAPIPPKTKEEPTSEKTPENPDPLIAMTVDWTHDKHEMARDLAEQELNAEVAEGKLIKRLWKGTLFKKYYEKKYEKEFFAGNRKNEDGKTVNELIMEQKDAVMERFILGATEDISYIHREIGKKDKNGNYKDGEKLEAIEDEETVNQIRGVIEDYARRSLEPGMKVSDLDREFKDNINRVLQTAIDNGHMSNGSKNTNYLDVAKEAARRYEAAINAREKVEHDAAMAQVMAGFKVYDAEVRNNVRTEAHRDAIDTIVNKLESSAIGQFIPAEILAGAAGIVTSLTQTGARAVIGAAGGIIASSAISGLKERNRITEDRARMLRDVANGMEYDGSGKDPKKLKGREKYEARIGGTLYDMQKASDLTSKIEDALNPENQVDNQEKLQAIAEAIVRIQFSDSEQKDLIAYSSAKDRGRERLELDKAVIKAQKALSDEDKKTLEGLKKTIEERIIKGYEDEAGKHHAGVEEQDKDFKKFRAIAAAKKAGKTLALGAAVFFGSQEVMAAIDPNKIGVLEKAGILKTDNANDAQETILASGFGALRGKYSMPTESAEPIKTSDPNEIAQLEANGYTKTETMPAWSESNQKIVDVDPSASSARVDVKYDGWANNGTKISDGNELRAHIENGKFVSTMRGSSTLNGKAFNYDPSRMKGYVTIGDSKFEIAGTLNESGQLTWGENGVFTTTTGETIKAIGDNGEKLYRYFEIALDNGVDGDGVQHIIPFATDVGSNTFSGSIQQVINMPIEHPATYILSKAIPESETFIRGITTSGIGFAPETARTGLGRARAVAPEPTPTRVPDFQPPAVVNNQDFQPPVVVNNQDFQAPAVVNNQGFQAPAVVNSQDFQPPAVIETPGPIASTEAPIPTPAPAASEAQSTSETRPATQAGSSETSGESDEEGPGAAIKREIENNAGLLGGDQGVYFLTNTEALNELWRVAYAAWWSTLSDYGKAFVRRILNEIQSSNDRENIQWGKSFRDWYAEGAE